MPFMPDAIVTKTGQGWKLWSSGTVLVVAVLVMFKGFHGDGNPAYGVGGMFVGLLSIIPTWFSIRCPKCKAPWVWMAVSTQKHNQWGNWLFSLKACPKCGYDAKPK